MFKPVQLEKNCVFISAATTTQGYHKSFLTISLHLLFFMSQTQKEENRTLRRLVTHVTRFLHPYDFPGDSLQA